ncbi:MAG: ribosome maturation factor RimM [Gemmatimonadota bacterium]|nr:ribosome maturation factor RimM [Gemmatimonadota bacterium]MDH5759158.1 ribosome maturation factor RimM [Gemmatimonadota bacterium]
MDRAAPSYLVVGFLGKPHGTHGEFLATLLTDHPESVFAPGVVLYLGRGDDDEPNPDLPPLTVTEARPVQRGCIVAFSGIEDRNEAEAYQGCYLFRPVAELAPLEEDEVFYHQLLGMRVVTVDGSEVGTVTEVFDTAPSDLIQVSDGEREVLIPFQRRIVTDVDIEAGVLVIDPPEGLLDL